MVPIAKLLQRKITLQLNATTALSSTNQSPIIKSPHPIDSDMVFEILTLLLTLVSIVLAYLQLRSMAGIRTDTKRATQPRFTPGRYV